MSGSAFEFATARRIVFGRGKLAELPVLLDRFGRRPLVVTGRDTERAKSLLESLDNSGMSSSVFSIASEPTVDVVRSGARLARECSFVIGFGGGSAIDAAKAIAAVAPNSGEPLDYLEVIGAAKPLEAAPLPFVAIPTTAGTGAEVTRNAVLGSPEHQAKASLRSPLMLLLVFATGNFPVAATAHPLQWETKLAQFALAKAIARQAPVLKNPLEPREENLLAGMKVFHEACDGCHGTANQKSTWGTTDFYPRVLQFGFAPPTLPDWQIFWVAKNGIRYTGMGGYSPEMSDDNAWKVALFLSRLKSLPPKVAVKWHQKNP